MPIELLERGASASARASTEGVRWLIDNADAYRALIDAFSSARRTIWLTQLAFDADCVAYDQGGDRGQPLVDAIVEASVERGVDVRILLNASLLLDSTKALRSHLARAGATRVQVRGIGAFPQLLHAKVALVDGAEAFLVGSPFANGYWDDAGHHPFDGRRPPRELGGRPLHEVSCAVVGPAVAALEGWFRELWNGASKGPRADHEIAPPPRACAAEGAIGVTRSTPPRLLAAHPEGVAEILPAIESAIGAARSFIYVEHQYLSARPVIDALTGALDRTPSLEVICVLNENPDVTAYRGWQLARLRESGLIDHPRVGLFALWSARPGHSMDPRWEVNQLFVHSKVLIVDDEWASVGSANLDGVSLRWYGEDFVGALGQRIFRRVRNIDVNVSLDDRDGALDGAVRDLRTRLWREHLGATASPLGERPAEGWLACWRDAASRNVDALAGAPNAGEYRGFALPYRVEPTPRRQLAALGIDRERVRLRFNPGWLEVHCSPNWVRNMFA